MKKNEILWGQGHVDWLSNTVVDRLPIREDLNANDIEVLFLITSGTIKHLMKRLDERGLLKDGN